jgi:hypothetical protein
MSTAGGVQSKDCVRRICVPLKGMQQLCYVTCFKQFISPLLRFIPGETMCELVGVTCLTSSSVNWEICWEQLNDVVPFSVSLAFYIEYALFATFLNTMPLRWWEKNGMECYSSQDFRSNVQFTIPPHSDIPLFSYLYKFRFHSSIGTHGLDMAALLHSLTHHNDSIDHALHTPQ